MRWASEAILLLTHAFAGVPLLSSLLHSFALPFVLLLALTFSDLVLPCFDKSYICTRFPFLIKTGFFFERFQIIFFFFFFDIDFEVIFFDFGGVLERFLGPKIEFGSGFSPVFFHGSF